MRVVTGDQAAAYEALREDEITQEVVIPLYAKRLQSGFASSVVVQNLSDTATTTVTLTYKGSAGLLANCSLSKTEVILAGGSLIQNHRLASGLNAVPELGDSCFGTLVITSSNQPIGAVVQLTDFGGQAGDTYMAHNGFNVAAATASAAATINLQIPLIGNQIPTP
jgi:hypothetical protein